MIALGFTAILVLVLVTTVFLLAFLLRNNSIMDIAYGLVFVAASMALYAEFSTHSPIPALVAILVVIWGIRLSARIFKKNFLKPEDRRYQKWRESWSLNGPLYVVIRSYLQVFVLQGMVIVGVLAPVIIVMAGPWYDFGIATYIGLAAWVVGFVFESVADYQLDSFLKKPENKGKIMDQGLFRYSRRPNYFGESLMWWGLAIIALPFPYGPLAFISPLLITYITAFVTGPITESLWDSNLEYQEYKKRTSYYIPWFPKKV